ncbi:MAG: DNA repair protein RecN [bacterium]
MLSQLKIQNFGLIDSLEIEFSCKLNIFTGETGAGKSILIDALRFCLGERLDSSQIRDIDKPCTVESVFEFRKGEVTSPLQNPVFSEYISNEDEVTSDAATSPLMLIINRTYLPDGRNRIKINGFNMTVSQSREIGNHLVDFHGANDHQMILSEESHIKIVDRLSDLASEKEEYVKKYAGYLNLQKKLDELISSSKNREQDEILLKHQITELEQVPLDESKYQNILKEYERINNSEKLYEYASELVKIFEDENTGLDKLITQAFGPMKNLNNLDKGTVEFMDVLKNMQDQASEFSHNLGNYLDSLSFNSEKTKDINSQSDIYYEILRKYGPSLEDAKKIYESAKSKYEVLLNLEYNDSKLKEEIRLVQNGLKRIAEKISSKRKKTAGFLKDTIEKELKELGIKNIQFECRIEKIELNNKGLDKVIFYMSPNVGEELKPLTEIVSGGESARVMLAIKKALTKVDPIPVLVFDEIDAQIGGRLGDITGKKLKELSDNRQVILITHLPQIAAFSDCHFKVAKEVKDNRTIINVSLLDKSARVKELAEMMSGEKESQIAVKHAQEMLVRVGNR